MLEVRNLTKVYRPKKGVPVTAIDHVSLRFPATGMVFLLGKSGSGKSTLLNLLGGLDRYDEGEILIKGASSADFRQQHFDSYRNTYVGFIFQEYNILEEFTVGANIALAIELQGKKATDEQINAILDEVDLTGYGTRRPNELSGGQKQRVAIARALVKQPRIIMADEPTGALDSVTGRQIFDTLKKLSADRLVLVVSHDREFAEQYADRIVELADGKVISDLTYTSEDTVQAPEAEGLTFSGDTVTVAPGYHLTEEDRTAINAYMDALEYGELTIHAGKKKASHRGTPTDQEVIPTETGGFHLIRSRLPLRSAFKIGAGSLKHKRFRLVITILLSCVAFGLFGLADTFGSYNHIKVCTDSLIDSGVNYASVATVKSTEEDSDFYVGGYHISEDAIDRIKTNTGIAMKGIYVPQGASLSIADCVYPDEDFDENRLELLTSSFCGLAEITAEDLNTMGYELVAGQLPKGNKDEIAIPQYVAQSFVEMGYNDGNGKRLTVANAAAMVGKTLSMDGETYTITGIVDTHLDLSRYATLEKDPDNLTTAEQLVRYALQQELWYARSSSFHTACFVGSGYVQALAASAPTVQELSHGYLMFEDEECMTLLDPTLIGTVTDMKDIPLIWLDGTPRQTLGEKELVVSLDLLGIDPISVENATDVLHIVRQWQADNGMLYENSTRCWDEDADEFQRIEGYKVVGYIDPASNLSYTVLTGNALRDTLTGNDEGIYDFAIGPMPTDREAVECLVTYCYTPQGDTRYELQNAVTYELDMIHEALVSLSKVFLYIGIGFAVFAAVMLANFITTSIAYKKQQIGILRAIGSRSNDVFRIFFAESFIIAMINFVLATADTGIATYLINRFVRLELNVLVTVLQFGLRQIVLLLAVSLLVAALASFFPVRHIAAKRPIDAIRDR